MDFEPTGRRLPWNPDPRWADPLIGLLALLVLLGSTLALLGRSAAQRRPAERATLQGRFLEVALAGPRLLTGAPVRAKEWARAEGQLKEPWDRALLAVLMAEGGEAERARGLAAAPPGPAGDRFRGAFAAAYGEGPLPDGAVQAEARRRLGGGYAAALLEARLRDRGPGGGEALRVEARRALLTRLVGFGALGLGVLALAVGGLAAGLYLWATRTAPPLRPPPAWALPGRAAALVFLLWLLAFFLAGNLAGLLLRPWPGLRWAALPLASAAHAAAGLGLLCWAEGISFRAFWRRLAPRPTARDLAWGGAFLALAVVLVMAVALTASSLLKPDQSPQRDLQELVRGLGGWGPSLALLLVVAGLAPCFEECFFRGFLLPVLGRGGRTGLALLGSALLFGAVHLQPAGLPTLATLGLVLGLAFRRTGSLWPPLLVHACWNGTLFLVMRALA